MEMDRKCLENGCQRNCTKMKRALERNRDAWKMHGQNVKGTGQRERKGKGIRIKSLQGKGAETAVKWKEVKGHARKLSGKTCKGSEVQITPTTHRTWRERN